MSENSKPGEPQPGLDRLKRALGHMQARPFNKLVEPAPEDAEPGVGRVRAVFAATERAKRDG